VATITFDDGKTPCADWLREQTLTRTILTAVSIAMSLIQMLLKMFIKAVSKYEAKHDATQRLKSTTTKMWVVQFISTAVILLLINADWREVVPLPENFPILAGKYRDFGINWYEGVGATICLTCFINAVMPWISFI
jgi:hypothetical protein